jgi:galactose-1-phosphate uridylyltransferase
MLLKEYTGQTVPYSLNGETWQNTYLTRIDPLSGTISRISEIRAQRNIGITTDLNIKPQERCDFCDYRKFTPEERVEHASGAISIANKYPWEKYDWITIYPPFGEHKILLSDLYFDDLERMIESSYDLAAICERDPEVFAFMDFTNWGPFAGASQQHPHSQRKSITFITDPRQEQELQRCRQLAKEYKGNPFDLLAKEERQDGRRVIYDDDVFIVSAFAPTCPNEVLLFPQEPISHILQTTREERNKLIRPALGILPALFFYRGVTDLNIAVHMAPFKEMAKARRYYRWHMHIYPRKHRLPIDRAGAEIGFETNVIDVLPESSASLLRQWYQEKPRADLIVRQTDGSPNRTLMKEFQRLMGQH